MSVPTEMQPVIDKIFNQKIYLTSKYEFSLHSARASFAHRNTVIPLFGFM